ncbi:MAG TPA: AI-2E family transporter [Pricia sp.]|nr:AI-2E family transporter [Pricia sp.]
MNRIDPKIISQVFVLLLILLLGGLIFYEMLPYLTGVLGAVTIYVILRRPMAILVKRGWRPGIAATVLMFLSFICILVPVAGTIVMLGNKIGRAAKNSEKVLTAFNDQVDKLESLVGYEFSSQIDASGISSGLSKGLQGLVGGTFNAVIAIAIMYFMLYYMLTNRRQLRESLYQFIPIGKDNLKTIGEEIKTMVKSNALGIPMVALAQGLVALIGFFIFGVQNPFFWGVIVTIGSMIPFVGGLLGIVPVFIIALSQGNTFQAWGVLLYGIIIIGSTDNLIRLYVLKKIDDVHPLITLIGVIVGVPLFGFIGLIFGPLLISLFPIIVRIHKKEYGKRIGDSL